MRERDRHGSFSDRGSAALHGTMAHVTRGEESGNIRLEIIRITIDRPVGGPLPIGILAAHSFSLRRPLKTPK